jgi:CBS domain containing-hemolysin-like protein
LGEVFTADGYRFEVIDLDGLRIDKVLVADGGLTAAKFAYWM